MDLKQLVYAFDVSERDGRPVFYLKVSTGSTDNLKPELVLEAMFQAMGYTYDQNTIQIHRRDVYAMDPAGDGFISHWENGGSDRDNMNRFIITTTEIEKKEYRIAALCDARQKLIEVTTESMTGTSVLGNIYIGRVENVVKNLNAAFVCIAPGQNCYLPLQELKNPVFTKKQSEKKAICAGDELLVQVVKEALKTKDPSVSTNLTFTGKYVILTTGKRKIGASSKLPKEKREKLLKIVEDFLSGKEQIPYGVIIRTNAAQASKEELLLELAQLEAEVQKIISGAKYLIRYSLVHKEEQPWQKMLNGLYETELGEVVTDDREIFETICNMYGVGAKQLVTGGSVRSRVDEILTGHGLKIRYYEDEMVSLSHLAGSHHSFTMH